MHSLSSRLKAAGVGLVLAAGTGLLAAVPLFMGCLIFAGGGHGIYAPAYLVFAPVSIAWASEWGNRVSDLQLVGCFVGSYALYALLTALARLVGKGVWMLAIILPLHYAAAFWLWSKPIPKASFDSIQRVGDFLMLNPFGYLPLFLGLFVLFVALHVLAFQYARSGMPYRPRMTRLVIGTLAGTLVVGIALCVAAVCCGDAGRFWVGMCTASSSCSC